MAHHNNNDKNADARLRALLVDLANATQPSDTHVASAEWWCIFRVIVNEFRTPPIYGVTVNVTGLNVTPAEAATEIIRRLK